MKAQVIAAAMFAVSAAQPAGAQTGSDSAPSERAKRDADKVFQIILQHADKPRRSRDAGSGAKANTAAPTAPRSTAASAPPTLAATPIDPAKRPAAAPLESLAAVPVANVGAALPLLSRNTKLELVSSVEPAFPARVLRAVGSGAVLVNFDVIPDGSVARAEVVRSPHRALNQPAIAAVLAWRFKPVTETVSGSVELKFE